MYLLHFSICGPLAPVTPPSATAPDPFGPALTPWSVEPGCHGDLALEMRHLWICRCSAAGKTHSSKISFSLSINKIPHFRHPLQHLSLKLLSSVLRDNLSTTLAGIDLTNTTWSNSRNRHINTLTGGVLILFEPRLLRSFVGPGSQNLIDIMNDTATLFEKCS